MNNEQDERELVEEQEEEEKTEASRRDFLRVGSMGLAGVARTGKRGTS